MMKQIKEEILISMKHYRKQKNNGEYKEEKEGKFLQRIFIEGKYLTIEDINNIKIEMFDKFGERTLFSWDYNFKVILKYRDENDGKNPVSRDTKNKGYWLSHQFEQYKKGEMSVERKDKFDKYDLIDIKKWNIKIEEKGKNIQEKI